MNEFIKNIIKYFKESYLGIIAIIFYFGISYLAPVIVRIFNVQKMNNINYQIFSISYYVVILSIIMIIFNKKITKDYKDFKKNNKKYLKENIKYYLIGLAIMFISNAFIIFVMKKGLAGNESEIRDSLEILPVYIYIASVVIAPALEELIFRHGISTIIKNKYAYILISGLIFGGLHVVNNLNDLSDLVYLVPYCSLGFFFAYIYSKTKNIFTTISIHTLHNGILINIQILLMLFN